MAQYRQHLPQLDGEIFLTDAGVETDLIFNHGIEIREFAAHTLLPEARGRAALENYFTGFLDLARELEVGFILDTVTWKAHRHWAKDLGATAQELKAANLDAVAFVSSLRNRYSDNKAPVVLSATVGPCGDAYKPEVKIDSGEAEEYYAEQLGWLANTELDMVTGLTFNQSSEAVGLARAARKVGLPCVISYTVETDGALPDGQSLGDAIDAVEAQTDQYPAYYMINCAHPEHFETTLTDAPWARRIRGIRANASRCSHAELDEAPELDDGDPDELAAQYGEIRAGSPWINIFGGCCGSDLRHVTKIAKRLTGKN